MRSELLAITAQDLGTEDKEVVGVDSGKVRCSFAEIGVV